MGNMHPREKQRIRVREPPGRQMTDRSPDNVQKSNDEIPHSRHKLTATYLLIFIQLFTIVNPLLVRIELHLQSRNEPPLLCAHVSPDELMSPGDGRINAKTSHFPPPFAFPSCEPSSRGLPGYSWICHCSPLALKCAWKISMKHLAYFV